LQARSQTAEPSAPHSDNGSELSARPRWREIAAQALFHSGALRVLQAVSRRYELKPRNGGGLLVSRRSGYPKFVVLCYHRVGMGGIPLFSELSPELFEAQMHYVRERYRVVSLDELCEEMEKPSEKEDAVAITFDDGYRDLYTHALPTLRKYEIPATIYLPVASIETGQVPWYDRIFLAVQVFPKHKLEIVLDRLRSFRLGSFQSRLNAAAEIIQYLRTLPDEHRKDFCGALETQVKLPQEELEDRMLTWDQIRSMRREGITFGSHTMTHPAIRQLTRTQLERELGESKKVLEERIGKPAVHFAFPFGKPADNGTAALSLLGHYGYRSATTTVEGANESGDSIYELRRTQIVNERTLSMFAFKLNQLFLSAGAANMATAVPADSSVNLGPSVDPESQRSRASNA
jgi:peptidoglycan/xylan/chitin deacetylase (PgdA/CDA1 family)